MSTSVPPAGPSPHRPRRHWLKITRRLGAYVVARIAYEIVSMLPLRGGLWLSRVAGAVAFLAPTRTRRVAIANLTRVFGQERTPAEIRRLAREATQNIVASGVEFIILRRWSTARLEASFPDVAEAARQVEREARATGGGAIAITAHLGNWELLALFLHRFAPGLMVSAARRVYDGRAQRFLEHLRTEEGMEVVYTDEPPLRFFRLVRQGRLLGILPDQNLRTNSGVFVDFFGRPAWTVTFPVDLARRAHVPILFGFLLRQDPTLRRPGFELRRAPTMRAPETGDEAADQLEGTRAWTAVVEAAIRESPTQWAWIHDRWRNQPGNPRLTRLPRPERHKSA